MELADTHCHVNDAAFDADRGETLARAAEAGVSRLLCIGADRAGSRRAVGLADAPEVYAAVGIHPEAGAEWDAATRAELRGLFSQSRKIVAYGEIGLDYHWETIPRRSQWEVFAEQVAFAQELSPTLPLIIHGRDGGGGPLRDGVGGIQIVQDDVLRILRESGTSAPIIMHCFGGDEAAARAVLDAGCWLGVGGIVTFKKSDALRAAVAAAPLDRLLLETDCPYLAPQPQRGRRNEPSYIPLIAQAVADARGITVEAVAAATTANARALFGW